MNPHVPPVSSLPPCGAAARACPAPGTPPTSPLSPFFPTFCTSPHPHIQQAPLWGGTGAAPASPSQIQLQQSELVPPWLGSPLAVPTPQHPPSLVRDGVHPVTPIPAMGSRPSSPSSHSRGVTLHYRVGSQRGLLPPALPVLYNKLMRDSVLHPRPAPSPLPARLMRQKMTQSPKHIPVTESSWLGNELVTPGRHPTSQRQRAAAQVWQLVQTTSWSPARAWTFLPRCGTRHQRVSPQRSVKLLHPWPERELLA